MRILAMIAVALVLAGLSYLRSRDQAAIDGGAVAAPPADTASATAPRRAPAPTTPTRSAPGDAGRAGAARGTGDPGITARTDSPRADERYDLDADEARGGHTIARHVGRTDAQLRQRLADEPGIGTASTYATRALAERTIARTLRANADRVRAWTERRGNRPNLALDYRGSPGEVLGRSIRRGRQPVECHDAVVVLRWDGRGSYVLTSYPEPSR